MNGTWTCDARSETRRETRDERSEEREARRKKRDVRSEAEDVGRSCGGARVAAVTAVTMVTLVAASTAGTAITAVTTVAAGPLWAACASRDGSRGAQRRVACPQATVGRAAMPVSSREKSGRRARGTCRRGPHGGLLSPSHTKA